MRVAGRVGFKFRVYSFKGFVFEGVSAFGISLEDSSCTWLGPWGGQLFQSFVAGDAVRKFDEDVATEALDPIHCTSCDCTVQTAPCLHVLSSTMRAYVEPEGDGIGRLP